MKSIYSILTICFFLGLGFASCSEEELGKRETSGDGRNLQITISTAPSRVSTPLTKATKDDTEKVNNLCVLIYDSNGELIPEESKYYSVGGDDEGLSALSEVRTSSSESSHTYTLAVEPGAKTVYLLANAGDVRNTLTSKNLIESYSLDLKGENPQLVMYAGGQSFDLASGTAQISARLVRIYSMLTVKVETSNLNNSLRIVPISLQLKHIPSRGYVVGNGITQGKTVNKIDGRNVVCVEDGEVLEAGSNQNFLIADHAEATPLFLYENMQGKGFNTTTHRSDQAYKTPPSIREATKDREISGKDKTCSYIELKAKYEGRVGGVSGDKIIYRFFLGEDAYNDFNIERNCYYKLTLNITGDGGVDEASWRVTKEFMGQIEVSDAYVGYLSGSQTYVSAVGDVDQITDVEIKNNPTVDGSALFSLNGSINVSPSNRHDCIIVNQNNIHDFKTQTCTLVYKMKSGKTVEAVVTQVPRLVDPIAIFKPAQGEKAVSETVVDVREFLYKNEKNGYFTLTSEGPWSATIKSSPGNWFQLSNGEDVISKVGESFKGTSDQVKFTYKPLSVNGTKSPRVGIILVKYHNEQCEHEIVLRQGYQDTKLGDATWSMYNCLGVDQSGNVQMTKYPTQTGWLFRGCSNVGMQPFDPGWMDYNNPVILCSDGYSKTFDKIDFNKKGTWSKHNPCPSGYVVASSNDFSSLANSSKVITGYVHDEDPNSGYTRNGKALKLDNTNSCNPAKGALFVASSGDPVSIFLTFGKGVLTSHPEEGYIDEVGVGHRGVGSVGQNATFTYGGGLNYAEWAGPNDGNKKYGAIYWTSTPGVGSNIDYHSGKADFPYNMFTSKIQIDATGKSGLHGKWHGNFVRCVKSK